MIDDGLEVSIFPYQQKIPNIGNNPLASIADFSANNCDIAVHYFDLYNCVPYERLSQSLQELEVLYIFQ